MKKIIAWNLLINCFSLSLALMFAGFFDTFSEFTEGFLFISIACYVCLGLTALMGWCVKILTEDANKAS